MLAIANKYIYHQKPTCSIYNGSMDDINMQGIWNITFETTYTYLWYVVDTMTPDALERDHYINSHGVNLHLSNCVNLSTG